MMSKLARPAVATLLALAAVAFTTFAGPARATLVSLGDGTVKDTQTNLIWLQDWGTRTRANWSAQTSWADALDFAGSTAWRLPELSEFETLFASYGAPGQLAAFANVSSEDYWSATLLTGPGVGQGWAFRPVSGGSKPYGIALPSARAVAVRAADAVAVVPEPQSLTLALVALAGLCAARHRCSRTSG